MGKIGALIKRELISYFSSPLAYIVLTAFLLLQGFVFVLIVSFLGRPGAPVMEPLELFFGQTIYFWLLMLFLVPVITMRLIAEERRSGTIEVLLTAPLTETGVVVGKFLAALAFWIFLWVPTLIYVAVLASVARVDLGPVAAGYLGVVLLGVLFMGWGTFTSTVSKNQIVAAVLAFAGLVLLFSVPLVDQLLLSSSPLKPVLAQLNLWQHMGDYARGIVDTRHVVFAVSAGAMFLFFAIKSLEVNKWR